MKGLEGVDGLEDSKQSSCHYIIIFTIFLSGEGPGRLVKLSPGDLFIHRFDLPTSLRDGCYLVLKFKDNSEGILFQR